MTAGPGLDRSIDALPHLLADWLPGRRWFTHKASAAGAPVVVATADLDIPDLDVAAPDGAAAPEAGPAAVRVHLVRVAGALYQVPLVYRTKPAPGMQAALVAASTLDLGDGPRRYWVYDGPHDGGYVRALLDLLARAGQVDGAGLGLAGRVQPGGPAIDRDAPGTVLSGEQSNTSVIVGAGAPSPLIVKVFRVVAPGENPDVVVQSALSAAGSTRVPRPAGWLEGSWPDGAAPGGRASGHLALAGEFLPGSEDAWRVATRAVAEGTPFAGPARDLGTATAQVHAVLADVLPTRPVTGPLLDDLADTLLRRSEQALAQAPQLADLAGAVRARMDGVRGRSRLPDLQQVHGDYHLGQVLHVPERGWVLLDFEGEPLRPLSERLRPDLPLRDVAGMLRSFDYAAAFATIDLPADDPRVAAARSWAQTAREAFLDGYAAESGTDPRTDPDQHRLLEALELDKALYEVVYEARNRPTWVGIPLAAVHRLVGESPA